MAQTLDLCLSELEQQGEDQSGSLQQTVNSMLVSDDKLFAGLQKLGRELEMGDPEEKEMEEKLREICARSVAHVSHTPAKSTLKPLTSKQTHQVYRRNRPY